MQEIPFVFQTIEEYLPLQVSDSAHTIEGM